MTTERELIDQISALTKRLYEMRSEAEPLEAVDYKWIIQEREKQFAILMKEKDREISEMGEIEECNTDEVEIREFLNDPPDAVDILEEFIRKNMDAINEINDFGETLLTHYCSPMKKNYKCAELLLQKGASIDKKNLFGFTPIEVASISEKKKGYYKSKIVKLLDSYSKT